jgi:hypothetical protein
MKLNIPQHRAIDRTLSLDDIAIVAKHIRSLRAEANIIHLRLGRGVPAFDEIRGVIGLLRTNGDRLPFAILQEAHWFAQL